MSPGGSKKPIAVYGAIVANAIIAVAKFVAAFLTGSSAMISEGIHSVVDTGNQTLLLLGVNLSERPADEAHPFGHGKEIYFWGMIVAMVLFGVGGGISIYEGYNHIRHPTELGDPTWNYVVLGVAVVVESVAFYIAFKELLAKKTGQRSVWEAVRKSKDPAIYTVLGEDAAALAGLLVAFLGLFFAHRFDNPVFDGVASVVIGLILAAVAIFLAYETRRLILGESAATSTVQSIRRLAEDDPAVEQARSPYTMHFGPDEILVNLTVEFRKGLSATELTSAIDRLEKSIRSKHPQVKHIFIEADAIVKAKPEERRDGQAVQADVTD